MINNIYKSSHDLLKDHILFRIKVLIKKNVLIEI